MRRETSLTAYTCGSGLRANREEMRSLRRSRTPKLRLTFFISKAASLTRTAPAQGGDGSVRRRPPCRLQGPVNVHSRNPRNRNAYERRSPWEEIGRAACRERGCQYV